MCMTTDRFSFEENILRARILLQACAPSTHEAFLKKAHNSMQRGSFCLSLFSCNFDDQLSINFHRFIILCICWDTPSEDIPCLQRTKDKVITIKKTANLTEVIHFFCVFCHIYFEKHTKQLNVQVYVMTCIELKKEI